MREKEKLSETITSLSRMDTFSRDQRNKLASFASAVSLSQSYNLIVAILLVLALLLLNGLVFYAFGFGYWLIFSTFGVVSFILIVSNVIGSVFQKFFSETFIESSDGFFYGLVNLTDNSFRGWRTRAVSFEKTKGSMKYWNLKRGDSAFDSQGESGRIELDTIRYLAIESQEILVADVFSPYRDEKGRGVALYPKVGFSLSVVDEARGKKTVFFEDFDFHRLLDIAKKICTALSLDLHYSLSGSRAVYSKDNLQRPHFENILFLLDGKVETSPKEKTQKRNEFSYDISAYRVPSKYIEFARYITIGTASLLVLFAVCLIIAASSLNPILFVLIPLWAISSFYFGTVYVRKPIKVTVTPGPCHITIEKRWYWAAVREEVPLSNIECLVDSSMGLVFVQKDEDLLVPSDNPSDIREHIERELLESYGIVQPGNFYENLAKVTESGGLNLKFRGLKLTLDVFAENKKQQELFNKAFNCPLNDAIIDSLPAYDKAFFRNIVCSARMTLYAGELRQGPSFSIFFLAPEHESVLSGSNLSKLPQGNAWIFDPENLFYDLRKTHPSLTIELARLSMDLPGLSIDLSPTRVQMRYPSLHFPTKHIRKMTLILYDLLTALSKVKSQIESETLFLEVLDNQGTLPICQYCGQRIESEDCVLCSSCETPHHSDCWHHNGQCTTYACGSLTCKAR